MRLTLRLILAVLLLLLSGCPSNIEVLDGGFLEGPDGGDTSHPSTFDTARWDSATWR